MAEGRLETAAASVRREVNTEGWGEPKVTALLERAKARRRRRHIARAGVAAAALVALLVGGALMHQVPSASTASERPPTAQEDTPGSRADGVVHLADGSTATPLTEDTEIVVEEVQSDRIRLSLARGAARFDVTQTEQPRRFVVQVSTVVVSVLGTRFDIERMDERVRVRVDQGRVHVDAPEGSTVLGAGDERTFSLTERRSASARVRAERVPELHHRETAGEPPRGPTGSGRPGPGRAQAARGSARPSEAHSRPAAEPPSPPWIEQAESGEVDRALEGIEADTALLRRGNLDELLVAADTLRMRGHHEEALGLLVRAEEVAVDDPRRPLVAFTRARVLMTPLQRPAEAAAAFRTVRELAPEGPLAAGALAREAEARAQAGEVEAARELARTYLDSHPTGLHAAVMRGMLPETAVQE
ncbi:MAG: FecR domain-containing protein [Sandaracinaceae bacterium]